MADLMLGSWEGDPIALVKRPDGQMEGYLWNGADWVPGYAEEAFTKATVMSEEQFREVFPGVEPPELAP